MGMLNFLKKPVAAASIIIKLMSRHQEKVNVEMPRPARQEIKVEAISISRMCTFKTVMRIQLGIKGCKKKRNMRLIKGWMSCLRIRDKFRREKRNWTKYLSRFKYRMSRKSKPTSSSISPKKS